VASVEEIFLAEVAELGAEFPGDGGVVVDYEADVGAAGDRQNGLSETADFGGWRLLGAELDKIGAAVTKSLSDVFGRSAVEKSSVHEGVEEALVERFHHACEGKPGTSSSRNGPLSPALSPSEGAREIVTVSR
jgi:hypothetical protein